MKKVSNYALDTGVDDASYFRRKNKLLQLYYDLVIPYIIFFYETFQIYKKEKTELNRQLNAYHPKCTVVNVLASLLNYFLVFTQSNKFRDTKADLKVASFLNLVYIILIYNFTVL